MQGRNDMTTGSQNDWRMEDLPRKRKIFVSQNLWLYYRYLYSLVKEKKAEALIFYFWVFNRTIRMREMQDSRVINITHESDIWYFFGIFLDKTSLLHSLAFFTIDSWLVIFVCLFVFNKLLHALLLPRKRRSVSMLLSNNSPGNFRGSVRVFQFYIFRMSTLVFACSSLARNRFIQNR